MSLLTTAAVAFAALITNFPTSTKTEIKNFDPRDKVMVSGASAQTISVSQAKVIWNAEEDRTYDITVEPVEPDTPYTELITIDKREEGFAYIIGLRENTEYWVNITPKVNSMKENALTSKTLLKTETVNVVYEYPYEDGWTACFAGERASGLTAMPSSGAIYGSIKDPVTYTTIRRNEYGDYCCAMGLWYAGVGNRFLVELEDGTQFTVKICDSKGWADDADGDGVADGRFHWYGGVGNGKCVIEFIYDSDAGLPREVWSRGGWHGYIWNGLNLGSNIRSIKMIDYGEPITYD